MNGDPNTLCTSSASRCAAHIVILTIESNPLIMTRNVGVRDNSHFENGQFEIKYYDSTTLDITQCQFTVYKIKQMARAGVVYL